MGPDDGPNDGPDDGPDGGPGLLGGAPAPFPAGALVSAVD